MPAGLSSDDTISGKSSWAMYGKTLKSNDALRLEFIRSVIRDVPGADLSGERESSYVRTILLTFIKDSARTRLAPGDESALNAYLRDVIVACRRADADREALTCEVAALAKHVADNETVSVATLLQSLCEEAADKTRVQNRS